MAKTANLYARIEPEVKDQAESILEALGVPVSNPAFPVPDMSELTKEQLKTEIDKGFADVAAGRVRPAADVFAELREEYRL